MGDAARSTPPPTGQLRHWLQGKAKQAGLVGGFLVLWQALFQAAAIFGVTHYASVFYPPAGLSIVCLMLFGAWFTPVVALASLIAGAGYWYPDDLLTWAATTLAVVAGYGTGAAVYRRQMARRDQPSTFLTTGLFCLVVTATALGTAVLHGAAYVATGAASLEQSLYYVGLFWVGDLVGIFTVTPLAFLLLAYAAPQFLARRMPWLQIERLPSWKRVLLYGAVLGAALCAAYGLPGLVRADLRLWHLLLIPALGIALHGGLSAALLAVSVLNVGNVAVATLAGTEMPLPELQSLMLGTSLATLLLGAMASDRRRTVGMLERAVVARTWELTEANRNLAAASRAKSDFFSRMSHELRTPLNAVIGLSDILRMETPDPVDVASTREYAQIIYDSGKHLLHLVNGLLDLSKAEAGKLDLREELTTIDAVIRRACRTVQQQAEQEKITVLLNLPDALPSVRIDPTMMFQVVLNLLSNALKFTPDGGRIDISADVAAGEAVLIRIADTGVGMRPEEVRQAFEPFAQIAPAHNRRQRGTGLGLPIARSFVEAHGGTLQLESTPGQGTVATILLPWVRVVNRILDPRDGRSCTGQMSLAERGPSGPLPPTDCRA
ncbi:sensor histidine kinase [Indioceanicola profundi]|uniref:sensor histidine kinase n=1 Tax=Indioceanicola profundi TaxID=2220096 RepID=UPI0013C4BE9F|nr:ATP-binding protein [Indioceanicola profundi]